MNVRTLRLRLGWSQSELARHLNCRSTDVEIWENGGSIENHDFLNQLQFLARQVEMCCEEVKSTPVAESLLDETMLVQIEVGRVKAQESN